MNSFDDVYDEIVRHVTIWGEPRLDRTDIGTKEIFGYSYRLDLRDGFPLLRLKKTNWRWAFREMLWFISGSNTINDLGPAKALWEPWANADGTVDFLYGFNWRNFSGVDGAQKKDQLADLIAEAKKNPNSRRLMLSAWNPLTVDKASLPPCHFSFQLSINGRWVDMVLYQRSCDVGLGLPFNVCQYAFLLHLIANELGKTARHFHHNIGNLHIYNNHMSKLTAMPSKPPADYGRTGRPDLNCDKTITEVMNMDLSGETFVETEQLVVNYYPHPYLNLPVAV